jgi:predicted amidohydrolase YtcJ
MTNGVTRREFLGSMAGFALLPLEQEKPELILHNANVCTVNAAEPRAQAVAIARGRFLAVGSNSDVLNLAVSGVQKIDLGGKTALPGFIDAHSHPSEAGRLHLRMVDCDLRSIPVIQAALQERARKTPAGEWVLGFKYDDTKTEENRALTISDLDAAVPDHPVHIQHRGGHTAYANSLAFRKAGIDEKTPDPPGGQISHDPATGKLSGRVAESANGYFDKVIPLNFTREDCREGVKLISKMLARSGITSATEAQANCCTARTASSITTFSIRCLKLACAPGWGTNGCE